MRPGAKFLTAFVLKGSTEHGCSGGNDMEILDAYPRPHLVVAWLHGQGRRAAQLDDLVRAKAPWRLGSNGP